MLTFHAGRKDYAGYDPKSGGSTSVTGTVSPWHVSLGTTNGDGPAFDRILLRMPKWF